jgi:hypothetical protein
MLENGFSIAQAVANVIDQPLFDFALNTSAVIYEDELWVFIDNPEISSPEVLRAATDVCHATVPDTVSAVHYVLTEWVPTDHERVAMGLGRSVVSVRLALRKLLDLPATFDSSQEDSIAEALSAIRQLNTEPIKMSLVDSSGERHLDAATKLIESLNMPCASGGGLLFVEAEAGKGKTILLASVAKIMRADKRGKLPIFIPLRKLPLESGIAWENITQLVGVVGRGAERLIRAVKAGLVTIFLDGIDEVSGRYDKNLIRDLLQLITDRLEAQDAVVILSGRRTEARHLNPLDWRIFSVELPELDSPAFKDYVRSVLDGLIAQSELPVEVPREYIDLMGNRPADEQVKRERDHIVDWILGIFPEVAKEPSLFFVQGLAAIAIGRRAGNRAALSQDGRPYVPPIWDVCLSAAVFACIRECSKVDGIARSEYSVANQMHVLQGFAALSSAPSLANNPTPNELVPGAFQVDPVNSPEVYVAITRQNAKHALLYATEAAGAYRPQFLSDWIRCSLIAQIFDSNSSLCQLSRNNVLKLAAAAERARYTFELLLPSVLGDESVHAEWLQAFDAAIADGFEAASTNQWALRAAVGDNCFNATVANPLPLAEITDIEFLGFSIDKELSGSQYFLDGTQFVNSFIRNVRLEAVSMRAVVFSNCEISNLELVDCDGPIRFEDCTLRDLKISNVKSKGKPALTFDNCSFLGNENLIKQETSSYGETEYAPLVAFKDCFTDSDIDSLLSGEWVAMSMPITGISKEVAPIASKPEACLRRALRSFFPSHIGSGRSLQARPYIRLSALGRGSMPPGSPGQEELQRIFETQGFTTGGRSDHLYGPWSSVAGASASGVALRNELLEFLLDSAIRGPKVQLMLDKIAQHFPGN